jgi:hypothetical protein
VTAPHRRAAARERQAAKLLRTERVRYRPRYAKAPDLLPVRLADGTTLQPEVKTRARLPRWLVDALAQAAGYLPSAVPLVVLSATGGPPLAVLPLADLARLLGLQPTEGGAQLPLAA